MKNERGWSLIELLIGISVAAIAGALLISIMVSSSKLFIDQSAQINHGLSLNQSKLEITELIKGSSGVVSQYPILGDPEYTTDEDTMVVKLPAISSGGDVMDAVYDYGVVEADPQVSAILRKRIFKDSQSFRKEENKVLSTNLKDLTFNYLDINNEATTPSQSLRVKFEISLSTKSGFSESVNKGGGTVNIKN